MCRVACHGFVLSFSQMEDCQDVSFLLSGSRAAVVVAAVDVVDAAAVTAVLRREVMVSRSFK